jgi:hypothetical protein
MSGGVPDVEGAGEVDAGDFCVRTGPGSRRIETADEVVAHIGSLVEVRVGAIYRLACPCGYQSEDLFVGVGFAGPEFGQLLAACTGCGDLMTVETGFRVICDCGHESEDHLGWFRFAGPQGIEQPAICPKCGESCIVQRTPPEKRCRECGDHMRLMAEPSEEGEWRIPCPNCMELRPLKQTGCWD